MRTILIFLLGLCFIRPSYAQLIKEYKKTDSSKILHIINDASLKYKGVIPEDCWKEPYMTEQKLISEFNNGVCMYGYHHKNKLIGGVST